MDAKTGVQQFLLGLLTQKKMDSSDLEKAIEIARTKSPSAAFDKAGEYCRFYKSNPEWKLGFAKGTRWVAMVRRELGEQGFEMYLENLRAKVGIMVGQPQWVLADGTPVIDRKDSHLASHAEEYPQLLALLPEALLKINPQGRGFIAEEVDMGREIGDSILVETKPGEVIIFAQRLNRQGLTRFVKNRQPESCQYVTVLLKKADEGRFYILMTAYVGRRTPDEPWSEFAPSESVEFWSSHALIWGMSLIVPNTETNKCPW